MFCPSCGNDLPEGARFCGACGRKIGIGDAAGGQIGGDSHPSSSAASSPASDSSSPASDSAITAKQRQESGMAAKLGMAFIAIWAIAFFIVPLFFGVVQGEAAERAYHPARDLFGAYGIVMVIIFLVAAVLDFYARDGSEILQGGFILAVYSFVLIAKASNADLQFFGAFLLMGSAVGVIVCGAACVYRLRHAAA